MVELRLNEQVVHKVPLTHGHRLSKVRVGTILAFKDSETAVVSFPTENVRADIPIAELQPASGVYGRASVVLNPAHRNIALLMRN